MSSLISLQSDSLVNKKLQGGARAMCEPGIMTMALVHEKLYQTDGLAQLDFAEYATSLLNYLWLSHGPGPGTEFQIIYNPYSGKKSIFNLFSDSYAIFF